MQTTKRHVSEATGIVSELQTPRNLSEAQLSSMMHNIMSLQIPQSRASINLKIQRQSYIINNHNDIRFNPHKPRQRTRRSCHGVYSAVPLRSCQWETDGTVAMTDIGRSTLCQRYDYHRFLHVQSIEIDLKGTD